MTVRHSRAFAALAAGAWLAMTIANPRAADASWPRRADSLVILHTNDIHARLLPFEDSRGEPVGGAAARARLLDSLRGTGTKLLLLDAGDVFQGSPFYNFFRGVPDYRSMSLMRYDLGALGNHELDDGPNAWLRTRPEASFPIVTANVFVAADSAWAASLEPVPDALRRGARWVGGARVENGVALRHIAPPYLMREIGGIRVAILGLTTGDVVSIVSRARNGGVAVGDPVLVAATLVPELRRKADIVIALTHVGVDKDRELATRVPGIDLIVGGHSHTFLASPVIVPNSRNRNGYAGTAIVQAGRWGERVGRLTVLLGPDGIHGVRGSLVPVRPDAGEDSVVATMLQPFRDSIATLMDQTVFKNPSRVGMAGMEEGDTPLGNFVADVMLETTGADMALVNSGGIRAPLPAGLVTVGDVYTVLPFDNTLVVVPMKGVQIRELLDFVARRIGKRGFAQVAGVEFRVRGGRAVEIRIGGEPLDGNRVYRVATIDYLYNGGDGYTHFAKAGQAQGTGIFTRDAAIAFLRARPNYEFKRRGRIRWEGGFPARDLLHSPR